MLSVDNRWLRADEFKIDPNHSSVNFAVAHAMGLSTVVGRFTAFEGKIVLDDKDISKSAVNVTIKTASINTDVANRDNDLRSPNYFDVEKFPEITFQSKSVEKTGNGYVAHGTLTIHPIGVRRVPRRWRYVPPTERDRHEPVFQPREELHAHLIEPPFVVPSRRPS